VKGGALLLQATRFVKNCEALERQADFIECMNAFRCLLLEQNQQIQRYQEKQTRI
jgi:hypothetical protein